MVRTVRIRRRATADLVEIARFIAETVSLSSAVRWRRRIDEVINSLAQDADLWPEADDPAGLGSKLRCRLFGRRRHVYRILFVIVGQTVSVLRVRHAAQDSLTDDDL